MVTTHATFLGCFYSPSPHLICATAPHAGWRLTTKGPVRIVPERGYYWQSLCSFSNGGGGSQLAEFFLRQCLEHSQEPVRPLGAG